MIQYKMSIWLLIAKGLRILGAFMVKPLAEFELKKWNNNVENKDDLAYLKELSIDQNVKSNIEINENIFYDLLNKEVKIWLLITENLNLIGGEIYYPNAYERLKNWNKDPRNIKNQVHIEAYRITQGFSEMNYKQYLWKKGEISTEEIY